MNFKFEETDNNPYELLGSLELNSYIFKWITEKYKLEKDFDFKKIENELERNLVMSLIEELYECVKDDMHILKALKIDDQVLKMDSLRDFFINIKIMHSKLLESENKDFSFTFK